MAAAEAKGSKFVGSSGEKSSAAGSDSLEAPESSSSVLFLLRFSGEAAEGMEFVEEESEACIDSEILSDEPALFSDSAGSLSRTEASSSHQ